MHQLNLLDYQEQKENRDWIETELKRIETIKGFIKQMDFISSEYDEDQFIKLFTKGESCK